MADEATAALERHAEAVVTVRAFAERSGAIRVVLIVDLPGEPVMVDCAAGGALELTERGRTWEIPAAVAVAAAPRVLPDVRPVPASAIFLDPDTGELEAPLGVIAGLARAVRALAQAFGGRSVATAEFATRQPGLELTIAAREGEPLVVAAGDRRFVLPDGV